MMTERGADAETNGDLMPPILMLHTMICKTFPRRFKMSGSYVSAAVAPAGIGTELLDR